MRAYAIGSLVASRPGILFGLAANALGVFAGNLLGLPPSVTGQLGQLGSQLAADLEAGNTPSTSSVSGVTGDPVAIGVTDACLTVAAAAIALQQQSVATPDPITGQAATAPAMLADPTYGLVGLASWGPALPAPAGLQVNVQQQAQQAIIDLVCSAAVVAVAQIYANTTWTTSNAAAAAKTQMLALLQDRLLASAAIGDDALYQAWLGVTGLVIADLTQRAQNLPSLTSYATPNRLPAPVLAQILYQDATQADLLVALNDVIHPGFMPAAGLALTRVTAAAS
jgi:prophage DNA circulation protein